MKKALILHGFEASSQSNWFPWLAGELSERGWKVLVPDLPNSASPNFDETMEFLRLHTADFEEEDIVIGHSLGAFWALKLAEEKKFGGLYLVAPAVGELPYNKYRASWPGSDVDALEEVTCHGVNFHEIGTKKKVVWLSEDDPLIPIESAMLFGKDWKVIRQKGYGHYCVLSFGDFFLEW